jgi:integrase
VASHTGRRLTFFGNEIGQRTRSIKIAWRLASKRAGVVDLHFHDLSREAGSRWLEGGVPLQDRSRLARALEHLSDEHVRRYEEHQIARVRRGATESET